MKLAPCAKLWGGGKGGLDGDILGDNYRAW